MDILAFEYPWIFWLLNIHGYARKNDMDMDMDMDGIFLIHGKPAQYTSVLHRNFHIRSIKNGYWLYIGIRYMTQLISIINHIL